MQIHELTKRRKERTDEGLLDSFKAGINAAKTVGSAAYNAAKPAVAAAKAVGQAATSPTFGAVASNQGDLDAAEKLRQQINKKYGLTNTDKEIGKGPHRGADEMYAGQHQDAEIKKAAVDATNKFKQTPEFATIIDNTPVAPVNAQQATQPAATQQQGTPQAPQGLGDTTDMVPPQPGHRLVIPTKKSGFSSNFYLNSNGKWTNEVNQTVTQQSTIDKLNSLANGGAAREEQVPGYQAPKQPKAPAAPAKPVNEGNLAQRAASRNAGIKQSQPAQPATTQSATPATADNEVTNTITAAANNQNVKSIFDRFSKEYETTPAEVKSRPEVQQAWNKLVTAGKAKVKQGKDKRVADAFQNYATVVLSAMKAVGTGEESSDDTATDEPTTTPAQQAQATQQLASVGVDKQAIEKVKTAVQQNPRAKPIVKQAIGLDEQLSRELRKLKYFSLNEDQVQITQDIVVKTNLGNYVKKAEDQTWYDPNGVPIDPVKYADYIKKLDATPAAQTRYQADSLSGRGSDTAFAKDKQAAQAKAAAQSAPIKATPALIQQATQNPDPVQQIADQDRLQAILRARNVEALNALTQDTFNQLQNAKIFKTGQEDYLNDRLKALMAMKA